MSAAAAVNPTDTLLAVSDVSISFRTPTGVRQVTHEVSFDIGVGETLALVGESGSGKSVTAMSLLQLLPHSAYAEGTAMFEGVNLLTASTAQIQQFRGGPVGTVFQEPMTALNPVYTIGAQLEEALTSHTDLDKREIRDRSLQLLSDVHMPTPLDKLQSYPHQLSGGQRQRAMISMAIANQPRLLIADEPTTALDVTVQAEILGLLRELQGKYGMSLLLITHNMGVVADMADDVVVMEQGRVVETSPVRRLFAAPAAAYTRKLLNAVPVLGATQPPQEVGTDRHPLLQVSGLVVEYPGRGGRPANRAVDDVSFELHPGETLGLVGESGSGKSTIGRAIVGLVTPTDGQIALAGQRLWPDRQVGAGAVSMVFQDPASSLNPRSPIWRCITDPLRWQKIERDSSKLKAIAKKLLEQVGLPDNAWSRFPHELSGGQRQRVGLARAIVTEPRVLIADEPTSALDVSVQATVLDLLRQLQADHGFACLFISHDLAVVESLAQHVAVLRNGQIVETGSSLSVFTAPTDDYTRRLLSAAPVPDPERQRAKRSLRPSSTTTTSMLAAGEGS